MGPPAKFSISFNERWAPSWAAQVLVLESTELVALFATTENEVDRNIN